MTTVKEIRDRLVESIALCDDMLSSEDLALLDREYISGMRSAFDKVLGFIE